MERTSASPTPTAAALPQSPRHLATISDRPASTAAAMKLCSCPRALSTRILGSRHRLKRDPNPTAPSPSGRSKASHWHLQRQQRAQSPRLRVTLSGNTEIRLNQEDLFQVTSRTGARRVQVYLHSRGHAPRIPSGYRTEVTRPSYHCLLGTPLSGIAQKHVSRIPRPRT